MLKITAPRYGATRGRYVVRSVQVVSRHEVAAINPLPSAQCRKARTSSVGLALNQTV